MSFSNYIAASYGEKIYSETQQLQRVKVKFAIAKNQLIFLEIRVANIMPKSFQINLLENDGYFEKAERLRQGVSKILLKDVNKKHRNNLTIGQRNAIREIKNSTNLKVYLIKDQDLPSWKKRTQLRELKSKLETQL